MSRVIALCVCLAIRTGSVLPSLVAPRQDGAPALTTTILCQEQARHRPLARSFPPMSPAQRCRVPCILVACKWRASCQTLTLHSSSLTLTRLTLTLTLAPLVAQVTSEELKVDKALRSALPAGVAQFT